ncbi:MAG: gamma-glutamyl-gamma-aminobutyrate hydrolase family protein [Acidobacteriaceae bacterium]|nr:gamma-glutamyl-gamma-aminobutyrate hydrolase family protein [Acidobacteriaceae bacterium]
MPNRVLIPYRHAKKVRAYEEAVRAGGMEPVAQLISEPVSLTGIDGLLLMGGTDVEPSRYGAEPAPETDTPDDERDAVELSLIDTALKLDLPIFAICRGLQILNVYHGGTLIQHLSGTRHDPDTDDKAACVHSVVFEPGSKLAAIAGTSKWQVNSRHHQAANDIGIGLRVTARGEEDTTVEGLERPASRFVVAVQWHPEDQVSVHPEQLRLFEAFRDALI